MRRIGASEHNILVTQGNLANTYDSLARPEALPLRRDVYTGTLKLYGGKHNATFIEASNYANSLVGLLHFEEAKSLMRKTMPVAERILGKGHRLTLKMRWIYAEALYSDTGATLNGLREAVTTLEETERIARRALGIYHPVTSGMEGTLQEAQAALRARETPPSESA